MTSRPSTTKTANRSVPAEGRDPRFKSPPRLAGPQSQAEPSTNSLQADVAR